MTSDIRHTEICKLFCAFGTARNLSAPRNEAATCGCRFCLFPKGVTLRLIDGAPELKFRAKRNELTSFFRKRLTSRDFDANFEGSRTAPAFDFDPNPTSSRSPTTESVVWSRSVNQSTLPGKGVRLSHFLAVSRGRARRISSSGQKERNPTLR